MTSRQRILETINHRQPDRVPVDLGATGQTGMNASTLYRLRKALGLEEHPIEISEIFQLLGKVDPDMMQYAGADVIGLNNPSNMFGVPDGPLKPFRMPDGTPTLIAQGNEYDVAEDGSVYMYPQGNRSVGPSGHMPAGGSFFDNINRAPEFDEDDLTLRRTSRTISASWTMPPPGIWRKSPKRCTKAPTMPSSAIWAAPDWATAPWFPAPMCWPPRASVSLTTGSWPTCSTLSTSRKCLRCRPRPC